MKKSYPADLMILCIIKYIFGVHELMLHCSFCLAYTISFQFMENGPFFSTDKLYVYLDLIFSLTFTTL